MKKRIIGLLTAVLMSAELLTGVLFATTAGSASALPGEGCTWAMPAPTKSLFLDGFNIQGKIEIDCGPYMVTGGAIDVGIQVSGVGANKWVWQTNSSANYRFNNAITVLTPPHLCTSNTNVWDYRVAAAVIIFYQGKDYPILNQGSTQVLKVAC